MSEELSAADYNLAEIRRLRQQLALAAAEIATLRTSHAAVLAAPAQTSLSPEQYAASQATEEETFLNNANAGLTPAQRAVAEYNACLNAGGCGVVK